MALGDPAHWATVYGYCGNCRATYCINCIQKSCFKCPACGQPVETKRPTSKYGWPDVPSRTEVMEIPLASGLIVPSSVPKANVEQDSGASSQREKLDSPPPQSFVSEPQESGPQSPLDQYKLAKQCLNGEGVQQDLGKAVYWLQKAADRGFDLAQAKLGELYEQGIGVVRSPKEAVEWYRLAAAGGYSVAQWRLGRCYLDGLGVPADMKEAHSWLKKAADGGFGPAQEELGRIHEQGRGVEQSLKVAAEWYRLAAEGGYSVAQWQLGRCCERGIGLDAPDVERALYWYDLAAKQDYSPAIQDRDRLKMRGNDNPAQCDAVAEPDSLPPEQKPSDLKERDGSAMNRNAAVDDVVDKLLHPHGAYRESPEIDGYKNLVRIAERGFSVIYRAVRVCDGLDVAVRTVRTSGLRPLTAARFRRQCAISAQLNHPNIAQALDSGVCKNVSFLVMKYLHDGSLEDLIRVRGSRIALDEAADLMLGAVAGLAFMHQAELNVDTSSGPQTVKGFVHRRISPRSILLARENERLVAKIGSYDEAVPVGKIAGWIVLTRSSDDPCDWIGPPVLAEIAPEHLMNDGVTPATDVFELAASFFCVLTGQKVWDLGVVDPFNVLLAGTPRRLRDCLPDAPQSLCAVFDRALAVDPKDRYPDGGAFHVALTTALSQQPVD